MKITHVEPLLISVPYEHGGPKPKRDLDRWDRMESLLVRVETDAGIVGWGEAFGFAVSPVTRAALLHVVGPLCIGRDPQDVPALMAFLRKRTQNMGRSGPVRYALSGIDLALWDIAGKVAGKPLHALFGGAKKAQIPIYASFLPYGTDDLVERNVADALERGYRHVKLHEHAVAPVAAARRAGGSDLALMLDTNCAWSVDEAIAMAQRLAEHDLTWLEEPVYPPDDYDGLARLRGTTAIPIAAGENVGTAAEVVRIADKGALDILQPDAIKIGGVSEMREASAVALARGLEVQPHSPFFGPAIVATLHVIATMDGDVLCERFFCDLEAQLMGDAIEVRGGTIAVPTGPGLGVTIDERVIGRYRVA